MKSKIFITGATGLLGKAMLEAMDRESFDITIGQRQDPQIEHLSYKWTKFDLADTSLSLNLSGVDTIFHLASSTRKPSYELDVDGTESLLNNAKEYGVKHFIYISIVGIEKVPIKYYKIKKSAEEAIENSGVPYTILRATQFHEFFEMIIKGLQRFPIVILPGKAVLQPIEVNRVAQKLLEISLQQPSNQILEIGGQEKLTLKAAMNLWLKSKGVRKPILDIPMFLLGKIGRALKQGGLTTDECDGGSRRWGEWLEGK
ncbi:MAG: nucleotide-diphosphate-sugar epimerase [Saprospiraceae bacterium]|nr:MAG: nucleotide-diphosphate-sugar epimerase [Saprospiraceae bacterium]